MVKEVLEWLCFGGSVLSVWLYGHSGSKGPISGIIVSSLFIVFGFMYGIYAALISNLIFLFLHCKNLIKVRKHDMDIIKNKITEGFKYIQDTAHQCAVDSGWWHDMNTGEPLEVNVAEKLCLIHSEISEAMEGDRKNLMDDKLPHRKMIEVELADAVIRIADLAGKLELDVGGAIAEKMEFNASRPDHKLENRKKGGGKKY